MKPTSVVRRLLVGVACVSLLLGTTAMGAEKRSGAKRGVQNRNLQDNATTHRPKVILVYVTGSLIPQRVVLHGQQVNSASPLYVVRNDELRRTGATSVAGMLSGDPSIFVRRR